MKAQLPFIYTLFLATGTIALGIFSSGLSVIIAYILFALYLVLSNNKSYLYIFYIIVCISNGIVPRESYILVFGGIHQSIVLITLIYIMKDKPSSLFSSCPNQLYKNVKWILLFLLVEQFMTTIKNYYYDLFDTSFLDIIIVSVNQFLMYFVCMVIFKQQINNRTFFTNLLICIPTYYSLTTVFIHFAPTTSLYTSIIEEEVSRYSGLLGNSDANTLSVVLVMFVSCILFTDQINKYIRAIVIALSIVTVGLTGSRTGLMALMFFIMWYVYNQKDVKASLRVSLIVFLLSLIMLPFLMSTIERFFSIQDEQGYKEDDTSNRVGKWMFYIDYFVENPMSILRGGEHKLKVGWSDSFRVAHNFYIQLIYNAGVLSLVYFIILMYNNIKSMILFKKYGLIITIQLFTILMFVSDSGALICYAICQFCLFNIKRINLIRYYQLFLK